MHLKEELSRIPKMGLNFSYPGTVHRDETYEHFLSPGTVHMDGWKNCPHRCLLMLLFYVYEQCTIKMNYAITM